MPHKVHEILFQMGHMRLQRGGDGRECRAGTGAIWAGALFLFLFFFYSFYERYHVGVSEPPLSLFMASRVTQGLVLMVYVGLRSQENTPAHVPHFRGVWFHWPTSSIATLTLRKSPLGLLDRLVLAS